ncbi:hypothetical protein HN807_06825 [Candidatus Bathyarchaeota archaeon]|nr:hypothetical protein [Candidatus Bathyarchaeota archaeon]MBT4321474.1 hypothetical protein [Candidatus Bathyarchaeota archaeon]MBT4424234.1 hypothetical protein [Candidatus Bathyarchaeota archaeon]MBT5642957.1 hypothetical protein [Candidatus Bathyarchaeota archaeon]MBT6603824.1 hypothetical protein [Candidatus Bathyarchaeota archaeon]
MVSFESIVSTSSWLTLSASFLFYGIALRQRNRISASQLRLEQIKFINDEGANRALTEILWVWEWKDFDEYWAKYSPRENPKANVTRRVARNYYVALASMIRKGDMDVELLYELNPSSVTRYWEKIQPVAKEFRRRNDYPDYLEPVEYLAGRIAELRKSKNLPTPGQVS